MRRPSRTVCRQRLPRHERHCVIVFSKAELNVGATSSLPCPPDGYLVNLVIDAYDKRAARVTCSSSAATVPMGASLRTGAG